MYPISTQPQQDAFADRGTSFHSNNSSSHQGNKNNPLKNIYQQDGFAASSLDYQTGKKNPLKDYVFGSGKKNETGPYVQETSERAPVVPLNSIFLN